MTVSEIVREISRLSTEKQFEVHQALTGLITRQRMPNGITLAAAARALVADYQDDPELTAFAALDSDDFYAPR